MEKLKSGYVSSSSLNQKSILIVEDEISNFELLKAMMRRLDVKIFWAKNGINAIKLCNENIFDLILMDIKMPLMDGYEATSILRRNGNNTPIIAQTAYARIGDKKLIFQKGFNGYLPKPIDRKELLDIIERHTKC